jgi:hypothetical protein
MKGDYDDDGVLGIPRNEHGHYMKGFSGNRDGRPSGFKHVAQLAREHTEDAVRVLAEVLNDPSQPAACRVYACNSLLDRAWGKPVPANEMVADADRSELVQAMVVALGAMRTRRITND